MKDSERVTAIADRCMDMAESETKVSAEYTGNEVMAIAALGSSRALLAMVRILRITAAELRVEEAQAEDAARKDGLNGNQR